MNISNMGQVLKIAQLSNDTVHMTGDHGIGKSQVVEGYAKENNIHLEILMLSQQETADLVGIPDMKDGITYWSKPIWLKRMEDASAEGKDCVLFLDELARAPLDVRQAALQLVLDRRIHEHHLPELNGRKTLVVAADNPADKYQTDELDAALLDRFATYKVEVDVNGWLKWARSNNIDSVVTDYIAEYPDNIHYTPEDDDDKGATPRGWAKLSDNIKNFGEIDDNLIYSVILSKVGTTVGQGFFHFYNNYTSIVKIEDILEKLGDTPIKTQQEQEIAGIELSELTSKIEAISASELAQKMRTNIEDGTLSHNVLSVFLGSINVEIGNSIAKAWRMDDDTSEFFFDWAGTVPNKWLFSRVIETYKK